MKNVLVLISVFIFLQLSAITINIPEDFSSIQEGIDVSMDGDIVLVQPGTYYENINFYGHNILVGSLFSTTQDSTYIEQTIIDGSQDGSVVTFESEETSSAMLIGFTITNGSGNIMPNGEHCGGGIFCHLYSDPTIKNCIITQNNAGDGGGIFCYMNSNPTITDVEISNNSTYDDGGGVHINWGSEPTFERVQIIGNSCADKGAGICCGHNGDSTDLILNNVLISQNTSGEKGSAIYIINSTSYFDHVTISDNETYSGYGSIYCENAQLNFSNSIIWNNENSGFHLYNGGSALVSYSNTQEYFEENGNISEDPNFVDPINGNYNLQEISPCIDCGNPNSPLDQDGTITDMGAFCFQQEYPLEVNFAANPVIGLAPLQSQFTDLTDENIVGWQWDFNHDGIIDSYLQNPSFTFNIVGTYSISLTVTDGIGSRTKTISDYITVLDTLHADFESSFNNPESPLEVQFTDLSIGNIIGWMWDFDNNGFIDSNDQNPIYTFEQAGTYDVSLTITDGYQEDIEVKFEYVTVSEAIYTDENLLLPETGLKQNYPNPFNPTTTIKFSIRNSSDVNLDIYNIKGQKVKQLVNEKITSGEHSVIWNGTNELNNQVSSGVYLYKLIVDRKAISMKKCILMQ